MTHIAIAIMVVGLCAYDAYLRKVTKKGDILAALFAVIGASLLAMIELVTLVKLVAS